jgi:hypothetical protein
MLERSAFDPGCVKTQGLSRRCAMYANSGPLVEHDLFRNEPTVVASSKSRSNANAPLGFHIVRTHQKPGSENFRRSASGRERPLRSGRPIGNLGRSARDPKRTAWRRYMEGI